MDDRPRNPYTADADADAENAWPDETLRLLDTTDPKWTRPDERDPLPKPDFPDLPAPKPETKAEIRAREAEARQVAKAAEKAREDAERARKRAEVRALLEVQRRRLPDDDDEPLRDWTPPYPDALPEIIVAPGERPAIADAALAAMAAAGVPFYQRGKDLVRVCLIKLKQSNGGTVRVPAVANVTKPMMLRTLGLCAKWVNFDLVRSTRPATSPTTSSA